MSGVFSRGELPLSLALRINEVCDRFELAWLSGPRPRLEDFLGDCPEPERSTLLRELIALDMDYLRRAGEDPTAEDYRKRFPALDLSAVGSTFLDSPCPPDDAAPPDLVPAGATQAGRYQIGDEIDHGGMGVVLRAHDPDLGRDLAVKVLREAHRHKPELVGRFVEEAQVGGQLQHPGVVPVYDLGRFPDGRPFFAMKLVKGQTLANLLRERRSPQDDLPRFVQVFAQVCQAAAYAHARGVIHRDLKPANVMVGAFGEVQVMDWGLAKVLRQGGADEPPPQIRTVRSAGAGTSSGSDTRAGAVLGTLAYMAPEQANGEPDRLNARADVFGLGAVLCEVLTGQPPYTGRDGEEIYRQAAAADTAAALARLDGCGADADLIALAKRCLAADPLLRPRDAGAVAGAVTAYQESVAARLRRAELERAAAEAGAREEQNTRRMAEARAAEERRRRQAQLGLAAAVLLLAALGGGAAAWSWQRQAEMVRDVEASLAEAERRRDAGLWPQARAALERAEGRLGGGGSAGLRQRLRQAQADAGVVAALEEARLRQAEVKDWHVDDSRAAERYAAAFAGYGIDVNGLPPEEAVTRLRASAVRADLLAALDDWSSLPGVGEHLRNRLRAVADGADDSGWRRAFRDAAGRGDGARLEALAADPEALKQPPAVLTLAGRALRRLKLSSEATAFLDEAQRRHPADVWLNHELAWVLLRLGPSRAAEAVGYFRAAQALRPDSPGVWLNLGVALAERGDRERAIASYRRALELDPKYAPPHNNLGNALRAKGQVDEAITAYRAAIALDAKLAPPHNGLGNVLFAKKQVDEAIREYRAAIQIDPTYALPHNGLGLALQDKKQVDEAITAYRAAIQIDPKFAEAHNHLGNALRAKGQVDEAITAYRAAIALDAKLAPPHNNLGLALRAKGKADEAVREYWAAIRIDPKYAMPHYNLGNALLDKGHLDEAIKEYQEAASLAPKYAEAHCNLGHALRQHGEFAAALEALQRGHEMGSRQKGWPYPSAKWVQQVRPLADLDRRATALLKSEAKAKNPSESLRLARFCLTQKKHPAAAARLYADAFAAEPALADDLGEGDRLSAAKAAALAGCGQGRDAATLDAKGRQRWRRQSLAWLRADLNLWARQLVSGDADGRAAVQEALTRWRRDPALAGLRDGATLDRLPDDERPDWRALWADVAALLEKAGAGQ